MKIAKVIDPVETDNTSNNNKNAADSYLLGLKINLLKSLPVSTLAATVIYIVLKSESSMKTGMEAVAEGLAIFMAAFLVFSGSAIIISTFLSILCIKKKRKKAAISNLIIAITTLALSLRLYFLVIF